MLIINAVEEIGEKPSTPPPLVLPRVKLTKRKPDLRTFLMFYNLTTSIKAICQIFSVNGGKKKTAITDFKRFIIYMLPLISHLT